MKYYLFFGLQLILQPFFSPLLVEAFNQTTSIDSSSHSYDVVIVGAGWCGMAAARTLEERGVTNYKILEASDRIGGRTQTVYEEIDGEIVALDMSTQWMRGAEENPLYDFAVAADVSFVYDEFKTNVYQSNNAGLIPGANYKMVNRVYNKFWYFVKDIKKKRKSNGKGDQPLAVAVRKFSNTLTDLNERLIFNYMVKAWIEIEYAGHKEDLSLFKYDIGWKLDESNIADFGSFWLKDWSAVVNTYAKPIENKIQTEAIVTKIDYRNADNFVRVFHTNANGEEKKIRAKKVLVTVSLGVLKKEMIDFKPRLNKKKRKNIDQIGMGAGNHMWMFFDEAFWPEDELGSFFGDGEDRENFTGYYNNLAEHGLYNKPGLMVAFMGKDAYDAEQRFRSSGNEDAYKEEVKELCMEPLRNMFGEAIPDPEYVFASSWMTNPYTHGIFSFNKAGQKKNAKKKLRESIDNRLYFRGEHTSEAHYGWANGAYWEGVAVAEEMAGELLG